MGEVVQFPLQYRSQPKCTMLNNINALKNRILSSTCLVELQYYTSICFYVEFSVSEKSILKSMISFKTMDLLRHKQRSDLC